MLLAVTLHRIVCESIKVSVCMISASTCTCCAWLVASTCNCIYGEFLVEKKIASVRIQGANDPRNKMQDELLLCPVTPSLLLFWRSMPTSTLHGFMLTHTHLRVQKIQGGCLQWQGFQCMEIVIAASRKATEGSEVTISKSSSSRRMEVCKHMWRKVPSRGVKLLKGGNDVSCMLLWIVSKTFLSNLSDVEVGREILSLILVSHQCMGCNDLCLQALGVVYQQVCMFTAVLKVVVYPWELILTQQFTE